MISPHKSPAPPIGDPDDELAVESVLPMLDPSDKTMTLEEQFEMQEMMKRLMSPTAGDGDGDEAAGAAATGASASCGDIDARWRLADAEAEQEDLRDRVQALTRENEELRARELSASATAVESAREDESARNAKLASLERELAAAKRERDDAIGER